jgi:uncharacterized RDD family membrane protein YckC
MSNINPYADQLNIETPEHVSLRFPIAGIGSRFLAVFIDGLIMGVSILIVALVMILVLAALASRVSTTHVNPSATAGKWLIAIIVFFYFAIIWGYFSLFEAFWKGQTPGKRLFNIRVLKDSGRQITLFEAMARNLMRVVDYLPSLYMVGVITMLCNKEHKRLGDYVAGTIVIHDRTEMEATPNLYSYAPTPRQVAGQINSALFLTDAIARLDPADLNIIDTFFARAIDLDMERRAVLAARITATMCGKMEVVPPDGLSPEHVLEAIAYAIRSQPRFQPRA